MNQLKPPVHLSLCCFFLSLRFLLAFFLIGRQMKESQIFYSTIRSHFFFCFRKLQIPSVGKARPSFYRIHFIWLYVSLLYDWLP